MYKLSNKAAKLLLILYDFAVASLADAWIKINTGREADVDWTVASLADAWIKIGLMQLPHCRYPLSHPPRMRGLKYYVPTVFTNRWGRIPRGCVD